MRDLTAAYDAVFLGLGLGGVNALRAEGEDADGVENAVEFIAALRQAEDLAALPVGRRVVVIGGGMTAIDAAVQSKLLGAEEVTICYRRGQEHMNASEFEQELATANGVVIRHWLQPKRVRLDGGKVTGIEMEYTAMQGDRLAGTGETVVLPADQVFKAIGQTFEAHAERQRRGDRARGGPHQGRRRRPHVARQGLGRRRLHLRRRRPHRLGRRAGPRRGRKHPPGTQLEREGMSMADIRNNFVGIKSPNPFWLASAPPTDKAYNVVRAFKAGWGGVVWKTLGEEGPPVVNVNGPRYGAIWGADRRLLGLNNIELITDRDLQVNLREIKQVKRDWPDRAMVVSLMVPCVEEAWKAILPVVEETGADGIELNFGCPHGMSERGMGAAVGQVPEYIEMVVRWCKANTRMPVITKLTPNITDVRKPARAAKAGGTDAVSLINTINSITGVNLDTFSPEPIDRRQGHAWRLLRPGGEADRHEHGGRDRPRRRDARPADLRHRRHHHLARRGRVHGARRRQRAGLHRGDDLRLQDRAGDDRRPRELDGREGPCARSTTSSAAPRPTSPTGSISTSTTSPRRASTRMSASNAAAATSPARTPRTRRSPTWSTASGTSR